MTSRVQGCVGRLITLPSLILCNANKNKKRNRKLMENIEHKSINKKKKINKVIMI